MGDSEKLLRRALDLAPGFTAARANLANVLYKQSRYEEAAKVLDEVLERDPASPGNRNLMAATLGRIGDYDEALKLYGELTETFPDRTMVIVAHRLNTVRLADRIIVMESAEVVEEGTHDELYYARGAYHQLVRKQI